MVHNWCGQTQVVNSEFRLQCFCWAFVEKPMQQRQPKKAIVKEKEKLIGFPSFLPLFIPFISCFLHSFLCDSKSPGCFYTWIKIRVSFSRWNVCLSVIGPQQNAIRCWAISSHSFDRKWIGWHRFVLVSILLGEGESESMRMCWFMSIDGCQRL